MPSPNLTHRPPHRSAPRAAKLLVVAAAALSVCAALSGCRRYGDPLPVPSAAQDAIDRGKAMEMVRAAQRLEYKGYNDEAELKYLEAVRTYRETPAAWNNMGRLLMKRGDNGKAAEAFTIAAEVSPRDPLPYYNLGALWDTLGYLEDAGRWYEESLKRDENFQPALRRAILIDQLLNRGNEVTARRVQRAILQETDPWWKDRLQRERARLTEELRAGQTRRGEEEYLKKPLEERPGAQPVPSLDTAPVAEPLPE
jgi:tetratricopeptide (TPR) repeat protein